MKVSIVTVIGLAATTAVATPTFGLHKAIGEGIKEKFEAHAEKKKEFIEGALGYHKSKINEHWGKKKVGTKPPKDQYGSAPPSYPEEPPSYPEEKPSPPSYPEAKPAAPSYPAKSPTTYEESSEYGSDKSTKQPLSGVVDLVKGKLAGGVEAKKEKLGGTKDKIQVGLDAHKQIIGDVKGKIQGVLDLKKQVLGDVKEDVKDKVAGDIESKKEKFEKFAALSGKIHSALKAKLEAHFAEKKEKIAKIIAAINAHKQLKGKLPETEYTSKLGDLKKKLETYKSEAGKPDVGYSKPKGGKGEDEDEDEKPTGYAGGAAPPAKPEYPAAAPPSKETPAPPAKPEYPAAAPPSKETPAPPAKPEYPAAEPPKDEGYKSPKGGEAAAPPAAPATPPVVLPSIPSSGGAQKEYPAPKPETYGQSEALSGSTAAA